MVQTRVWEGKMLRGVRQQTNGALVSPGKPDKEANEALEEKGEEKRERYPRSHRRGEHGSGKRARPGHMD